jgi:hypothetical protein
MAAWRLFRKRNSDGSTKDWAVTTHPDGSISTRWGKTASRLPSVNTRNSVRQFDIERQKQAKGYSFVAEVTIDSVGNVAFSMQNQNGNQQAEPHENRQAKGDKSMSLVETLYWHIDCQATHEVCVEFGRAVRRLLGAIHAVPNAEGVSANTAEPNQAWKGWHQLLSLTVNAEPFTQSSGQIKPVHGALPCLFLLALKHQGFTGIDIDIATERSREVSTDLKAESELLAFFGTDLDSIRPAAERLGLLKPKLNLALAMADQDDSWF